VTRTLVASIVAQAIGGLRLEYPRITKQQRKEIKEAKKQLLRKANDGTGMRCVPGPAAFRDGFSGF